MIKYIPHMNAAINLDKIYTIEVRKENPLLDATKFEVVAYMDTTKKYFEVIQRGFEIPEEAEDYIKVFVKEMLED